MSYEYHPLVRVTPTDGAPWTRDLREAFRDARGPVRVLVDYDFEHEDYDDVNRRRRRTAFGFRPNVRLTFDIVNIADHPALAEIETALAHPTHVVELSLDGGHTYRKVVMTDVSSPRALGGKTIVGARHELRLECVELLDEKPAMTAAGGW